MDAEPKISWPEVTKFIGQLTHDLRNHLNAVELQAAFLNEVVTNPEAKAEVKRLREMTGEAGAHLQSLARALGKIQLRTMPYPAAEFVEDLRSKLTMSERELAAALEWNISLGNEILEIDPQILQEAFLELLANAGTHGRAEGPLIFSVQPAGKTIEFTLREPKKEFRGATENWGARPLQDVRSGHYSLGLFRARSIFEAHHGQYRVQFDPGSSSLVTVVALPASDGN